MRASDSRSSTSVRILMWLCVAIFVLSTIPLYAISFYNHPYYDDYGFSADAHKVWTETGSIAQVITAAAEKSQNVRQTWQGTYTGTFLSNIQPGVFSESLYFIGTFVLLTAFILCFGYFLWVVFGKLGVSKEYTVILCSLALMLMIQFVPNAGEAFYWFNGGIGNSFIYALLVLSFALSVGLLDAKTKGRIAALSAAQIILMILLGGGSYGGGLFGLCIYALLIGRLFWKKDAKAWIFTGLWALFLGCFIYNMAAPGNQVRAGVIGSHPSAVMSILKAVYYGIGQIGSHIRLPIIAVSALVLPALYAAAKSSSYRFSHPWIVLVLMTGLYCTQLVPPIYGGVGTGGWRILNTYYWSFVVMWFLYLYYVAGYVAKHYEIELVLTGRGQQGLILLSACLLLVGCMGYKQTADKYYGPQNMAGPSAALSIVSGEAQQYHREMQQREALLNDASAKTITLSPLTVVPSVFMEDLIQVDAVYDVRVSLCEYYDKDAIIIEGEGS